MTAAWLLGGGSGADHVVAATDVYAFADALLLDGDEAVTGAEDAAAERLARRLCAAVDARPRLRRLLVVFASRHATPLPHRHAPNAPEPRPMPSCSFHAALCLSDAAQDARYDGTSGHAVPRADAAWHECRARSVAGAVLERMVGRSANGHAPCTVTLLLPRRHDGCDTANAPQLAIDRASGTWCALGNVASDAWNVRASAAGTVGARVQLLVRTLIDELEAPAALNIEVRATDAVVPLLAYEQERQPERVALWWTTLNHAKVVDVRHLVRHTLPRTRQLAGGAGAFIVLHALVVHEAMFGGDWVRAAAWWRRRVDTACSVPLVTLRRGTDARHVRLDPRMLADLGSAPWREPPPTIVAAAERAWQRLVGDARARAWVWLVHDAQCVHAARHRPVARPWLLMPHVRHAGALGADADAVHWAVSRTLATHERLTRAHTETARVDGAAAAFDELMDAVRARYPQLADALVRIYEHAGAFDAALLPATAAEAMPWIAPSTTERPVPWCSRRSARARVLATLLAAHTDGARRSRPRFVDAHSVWPLYTWWLQHLVERDAETVRAPCERLTRRAQWHLIAAEEAPKPRFIAAGHLLSARRAVCGWGYYYGGWAPLHGDGARTAADSLEHDLAVYDAYLTRAGTQPSLPFPVVRQWPPIPGTTAERMQVYNCRVAALIGATAVHPCNVFSVAWAGGGNDSGTQLPVDVAAALFDQLPAALRAYVDADPPTVEDARLLSRIFQYALLADATTHAVATALRAADAPALTVARTHHALYVERVCWHLARTAAPTTVVVPSDSLCPHGAPGDEDARWWELGCARLGGDASAIVVKPAWQSASGEHSLAVARVALETDTTAHERLEAWFCGERAEARAWCALAPDAYDARSFWETPTDVHQRPDAAALRWTWASGYAVHTSLLGWHRFNLSAAAGGGVQLQEYQLCASIARSRGCTESPESKYEQLLAWKLANADSSADASVAWPLVSPHGVDDDDDVLYALVLGRGAVAQLPAYPGVRLEMRFETTDAVCETYELVAFHSAWWTPDSVRTALFGAGLIDEVQRAAIRFTEHYVTAGFADALDHMLDQSRVFAFIGAYANDAQRVEVPTDTLRSLRPFALDRHKTWRAFASSHDAQYRDVAWTLFVDYMRELSARYHVLAGAQKTLATSALDEHLGNTACLDASAPRTALVCAANTVANQTLSW